MADATRPPRHGGATCVNVARGRDQNMMLKLDQIKIVLGAVDDAQPHIRRAVHRLFQYG